MKKIAIYNVNDDVFNKLLEYGKEQEFELIKFFDENLNLKLKDIFEKNLNGGNTSQFDKTFIILNEFNPDEFKILNGFLKKLNLNFIAVTRNTHNENWLIEKLLAEVSQEDEVFMAKEKLRELLVSVNNINLQEYDSSKTFGLKKALMNGFLLLNSDDLELGIIKNSINSINYFLENLK